MSTGTKLYCELQLYKTFGIIASSWHYLWGLRPILTSARKVYSNLDLNRGQNKDVMLFTFHLAILNHYWNF